MFLTTALVVGVTAGMGKWLYGRMTALLDVSVDESAGDQEGTHPATAETDVAAQAQTVDVPVDHETSATEDPEDVEKDLRLNMGAAIAAAALSVGGHLVYPPLIPLSLSPLIMAITPALMNKWKETRKNGIRAVTIIDFVAMSGAVMRGHFGIASFTTLLEHGSAWLIHQTEDHSRHRLFDIYESMPDTVRVEREGLQTEIPIGSLHVGDIVVVHAGETIPVDGVVIEGVGRVDERVLTGESLSAERTNGDWVHATTLLLQGQLRVRAERKGSDCVAGQIGRILRHSADYRKEVQSRGQRIVERGAVPTVALSAVALVAGGPSTAVAVMFGGIGYTMRYVGPLSIYIFLESAVRQGILVKDGRALEMLAKVDTVVFDKTGTLTTDTLHVERILTIATSTEAEVLHLAASAERHQNHPIANAIREAAAKASLALESPDDVALEVGAGLRVMLQGKAVLVGGERLMTSEGLTVPLELTQALQNQVAPGATHVFIARDKHILGALQIVAPVRPEAQNVVAALRARGCKVAIISGDQEGPTRHLARSLGIDEFHARVLPHEKGRIVERLRAEGRKVCFVGDGINDALALRAANVSVSLAGANTVATDNAPLILLDGTLKQLPRVFALAEELDKNLDVSTLISVVPGIAITAGVLSGTLGLAGAIAGYNASLIAAFANGLRPLLSRDGEPGRTTNE